MNIQEIREKFGLDAIVLFGTDEIMAAADIYSPNSCMIAEEKGIYLLCPHCGERNEGVTRIFYSVRGFERVEDSMKNLWESVYKQLIGKHRIGYIKYSCPSALFYKWHNLAEFIDLSEAMREEMQSKNRQFFERYSEIKKLNTLAFDQIPSIIRKGCTEKELYREVRKIYATYSELPVQFTGNYLSGYHSGKISADPTDKMICPGDTILVDALCAVNGVHCDTTRTFFYGEPGAEQRKAYQTILLILEETATLLRPGMIAGDIYKHMDQRLKEEGYCGLVHDGGHGLGYRWYEPPYFISSCDMVLKENMLVALEPGIYFPGKYGIRLENNFRVTKDGGEDLFQYKIDLEDFIIEVS